MAAEAKANSYSDYSFTETLDASGNTTSWIECRNFPNHTLAVTNTDHTLFTVKVEGTLDGTNFFGIDGSGNAAPDSSGNIAFTKASATYAIIVRNTPLNWIRLKLVSYSGGATAGGITVKYRGG
jgi:hypothetical protein